MASRILVTLLFVWGSLAAPVVERRQAPAACTSLKQRRSWHGLTDAEKKTYIDAELCLMKKPAVLGLRGAKTRFDELQSVHVSLAEVSHFVGAFFPFHRLYLHAHESLLETECGYTAGQPYWNESIDAGAFSKSSLLDPVLGFGGDGSGADQCITDGPFAGYVNTLGPGFKVSEHCIQRQINEGYSQRSSKAQVENCMAKTNYLDFWWCIEAGPHSGGHGGVGAEMLNPISSPGDPLFYLHHTWLDSLWAEWQDLNPATRLSEVAGNNRIDPSAMPAKPPSVPGGPGGPPGGPPTGTGPPGFGGPLGPLGDTRPADIPHKCMAMRGMSRR